MPVSSLKVTVILKPFLNVSILSNLNFRQLFNHTFQLISKYLILAQNFALLITQLNNALIICESIAGPTQGLVYPSSVIYEFSGDTDGQVTSLPFESSTRKSTKNSAASFIVSYFSARKFKSCVYS